MPTSLVGEMGLKILTTKITTTVANWTMTNRREIVSVVTVMFGELKKKIGFLAVGHVPVVVLIEDPESKGLRT